MNHTYTKKEALQIVITSAKEYAELLEGLNFLFIYRNRNNHKIEFFEAVFLPRNFQHLTGIEFIDAKGNLRKNAVFFYNKCLDNTITEDEIRFKEDGTTPLKLEALPMLLRFLHFSKMTAIYNGKKPKLAVSRITGTINYCLGFIKEGKYYVPGFCLKEDIRKLGDPVSQILAVMSKRANRFEPVYKELRYVAKGVPLNRLILPDELNHLISLEKYIEK